MLVIIGGEMMDSSIGLIIRLKRKDLKMTLEELSATTDISKSYLSQIENNRVKQPKANTLQKLASALKMDVGVLMKKAGYLDNEALYLTLPNMDFVQERYDLEQILLDNSALKFYKGKPFTERDIEKLELFLDMFFLEK